MKALYAPYSRHVSLEETLKWLKGEALANGIDETVMHTALLETFTEMAAGKTFPLRGGDTRFTVDNACMNIYLRKKMFSLQGRASAAFMDVVEGRMNAAILGHIQRQNREYMEKALRRHPFFDWNRSPIVKVIRLGLDGLRKRRDISYAHAN